MQKTIYLRNFLIDFWMFRMSVKTFSTKKCLIRFDFEKQSVFESSSISVQHAG